VASYGAPADAQTFTLARANSEAGACLALGFRFAGSASAPAAEILYGQIRKFAAMRTALGAASTSTDAPPTSRGELPTIETCLATVAIALGCVMAGTGDLRALRTLRVLRRRADVEVTFGYHMAIAIAIGLLFLGGGRLTLGTSKPAIAALVAALFPRFPLIPTDNRYHLQAFRHLYVLAAEVRTPPLFPDAPHAQHMHSRDATCPLWAQARCLEAVDVDTGEPAMVPVRVTLRYAETKVTAIASSSAPVPHVLRRVTPCILPPLSMIESVTTESPRYWGRSLLVSTHKEHAIALGRRLLWVKRKAGHLPYATDSHGLASIFCRPFGTAPLQRERVFRAFCNEAVLLAFSRRMCASVDDAPAPTPHSTSAAKSHSGQGAAAELFSREPPGPRLREFCEAVLYECLTNETPDLIPAYLHLYHLCLRLGQPHTAAAAMPSLRLLASYAPSALAVATGVRDPPIQLPFLRSLCHHVDQVARRRGGHPSLQARPSTTAPTLARVVPSLAAMSASMRRSLAFDEP